MKKIEYPCLAHRMRGYIAEFEASKNGSEWEFAKLCKLSIGYDCIIIEYPNDISLFWATLLLGRIIQ